LASGELERARDALQSLREIEELVATEPLRASTDLLEGMLEAASGDQERARTLLEDAVDRFRKIGAPFESAQARIELATTLIALDRLVLAKRELTAAWDILIDLGAQAEAERARRLLERPAKDRSASLPAVTRREGDVLELLAEGLTNRQIAERLVISEHTVHLHVTNLLRKLDLPSRSAAAVYAVREGMLDHK
jgi:ATP/maltotriose-dependent transcriptional regulator MalT